MFVIINNTSIKAKWSTPVSRTHITTLLLLLCFSGLSGGQSCTDSVDVQQNGRDDINCNTIAIFPRLSFTCDGRITIIRARVRFDAGPGARRNGFLYFQVWRPLSPGSTVYNKVGEVQLQSDDQVTRGRNGRRVANIVLTDNSTTLFQSGDVLGFYHPNDARYLVRTIQTDEYIRYQFNGESFSTTSVDLNNADETRNERQPLVQFTIVRRCPELTSLMNGMRSCLMMYSQLPYFEDTCNFTCNTGYELTGSDTRTCQSNGTWSGSETMCRRVSCPSLTDPSNGLVTCLLGDDDVSSYEDTCSFTCDTGYVLTGSSQRTCQSNSSWSGSSVSCIIMECPSSSLPMNSMLTESCSNTYQSMCELQCQEGFIGTGDSSYVCNISSDSALVAWMAVDDTLGCERASSSNSKSGSAGAAIGGAVGGVLVCVIIIALVLSILFWVRRSKQRKESNNQSAITSNRGHRNVSEMNVYDKPAIAATKFCDWSSSAQPPAQPDYVKADLSFMCSITSAGVSGYETAGTQYEMPMNMYELPVASHYEMAELVEAEQQIYETPYEDEGNCGPIYYAPPSDEQKIYEEFEGKRFRKLCHAEIRTLQQLGSGEFGVVSHGKWTPSSHKEVEVAIKTLNTGASDNDRLKFLQEAAIMCQFDHENVIKLHGMLTEKPLMIVLEYMSRGDLRNVLMVLQPETGKAVHEKLPLVLLKFCKEIAEGMAYLSAKQFVHRDLAARNILVSESTTCKIADFGMSRNLLDENYYVTSGGKIPVKWTAPEAVCYRKYSVFSDVWSYGCVLYEIWSLGHKPFEYLPNDKTLEKVESGYRLPPPPGCPRTLYRVMIKCWHPDPKSRPQFGQISRLLASNSGYLLSWSDEDKQIAGEDAMKLGAPLEASNELFYDLQCLYNQYAI